MKHSILILGKTGQLGQELHRQLQDCQVTSLNRNDLDLTQPKQIREAIAQIHPTLIINAAAYTAVDRAEQEPELAHQINGIAPGILAEETHKRGIFLIHYSTDYVFGGDQGFPYQETDSTNPQGVYGASKLAGEQAIESLCDRYLILRTAWVYGVYGQGNFVKTMLRLGSERETFRVVADQIGTPTWTGDLAKMTATLIPHLDSSLSGIYHYTNSGVASWYDFAVAIFTIGKQMGFPLQVQQVLPITTPEYPTPAHRPPYSVLATQKIVHLLSSVEQKVKNAYAPHWQQSLEIMLKNLYLQTS